MSMSISAMNEKQLEGCSGTANGYGDSNTRRESQETIADPENGFQSDTKLPDVPPDGGYGVNKIPFCYSSTYFLLTPQPSYGTSCLCDDNSSILPPCPWQNPLEDILR